MLASRHCTVATSTRFVASQKVVVRDPQTGLKRFMHLAQAGRPYTYGGVHSETAAQT